MKSLCRFPWRQLPLAMAAACAAWAGSALAQSYDGGLPRLAFAADPPQPAIMNPAKIPLSTKAVAPAPTPATAPPAPASDLSKAASSNWDGNHGGCGCDNGCGCGMCCCCPTFYAYGSGLIMSRDMPNTYMTTFQTGNNVNQLQGTADTGASWGGGFEVGIGWNVCCDNAVELSYFGIWGINGTADLYDPNNQLSTPMDTGNVYLPDSSHPAGNYFDNAREHRITREDQVNNVELNWIYHALDSKSCNSLNVDLIAGIRWFNFSEKLEFASLAGSTAAGNHIGDDPANTAYLDVNVDNNLVGFQVGSKVDWKAWDRLSMFVTPKFGVYGNHMTSHSSLTRGDGAKGVFTDSGDTFDLHASKNVVSFMASADLGVNYDITSNWSVFGGYRVVAVTGVALSDNQIYPFLAGEADYNALKSNGSLILHGVFIGSEFRW